MKEQSIQKYQICFLKILLPLIKKVILAKCKNNNEVLVVINEIHIQNSFHRMEAFQNLQLLASLKCNSE